MKEAFEKVMWKQGAEEEITAVLVKNRTWDLVSRSPDEVKTPLIVEELVNNKAFEKSANIKTADDVLPILNTEKLWNFGK